jgi:excisionase family DNA binding protein
MFKRDNTMENIVLDALQKQEEQLKRIETQLTVSKQVLNLDEVCIYTGISKSFLYKLTSGKKIPFYKQAKHLYFDRMEIENWLKENRHTTIDEIEKQANKFVILNNKK